MSDPSPPIVPVDSGEETTFPIVGVGASAGGLEAFTQLLSALPTESGLGFVLVQHLARSHPSALAEILSRATAMPVTEVNDETIVEPDHVYVIPPGMSMQIIDGVLRLEPREEGGGLHLPIDEFLLSLAADRHHLAFGVILSGTASDGTIGLKAIKAEGGITFAQDASAEHDGMPKSAVASGCVDFVLSPTAIARELAGLSRLTDFEALARESSGAAALDEIVHLLEDASGVNFRNYKFNTFYRRITRRMVLEKKEGLEEYVEFLKRNPAELDALYRDILISVTSFFRDPESFRALEETVFPSLTKDRSRHEPIRVWTLGCSTGEEVYSIAIAYAEFCTAAKVTVPLQIFATDLNSNSIDTARAGVYSVDAVRGLSPERLERFFTPIDGRYRIAKSIRDVCVFSRHNVLSDPPFSRLDLISCRNLLIYLEPPLQSKVLATVHFGLKATGFLWLGGSESIGLYRNLFEALDAKNRIYSKKAGGDPARGQFSRPAESAARPRFTPTAARQGDGLELHREADRILSSKFAPPAVLVSAELDILQYRGDVSPYLSPAPGRASLNLDRMLREGLLPTVRTAVQRAENEKATIRQEAVHVKSDAGPRTVAVEVIPLPATATSERGFLILFEAAGATTSSVRSTEPSGLAAVGPESAADADIDSDSDSVRLMQELFATREHLQSVIEQQEAVNEELQSTGEELQSSNEELQSTNEELETSKEEIQSTNEELATVNAELQNRNTELDRVNADLRNLIGNVDAAIIMLGPDLRIRRFTPPAERLFSLIPGDVGRPLADVRLNLDDPPELAPLLGEVLATAQPQSLEVRDRRGRWYSLRLRPYRNLENQIDGVIVMLVDVNALKRAHTITESIVATVREPLLVLGENLIVRSASRSFYYTFRTTPTETEGELLYELGHRHWDIPELRRLLEEVLPQRNQVTDFEVEREFLHLGLRTMRLNARRLMQPAEDEPLILLAIEDVTEKKRLVDELRRYAAELSESDRRKNEFLAILAHELRNPLAPIRNALQFMRLTGGLPEAVRSASEMMERQMGLLVRLVEDLLDVSRISRGKIELRRERVDLASIVHRAIEANRDAIELAEQTLTVTVPDAPVMFDADPMRLIQIVVNLLNNSTRFTARGGRIEIRAAREGDDAVIRVRDSGIGIAAEKLPFIFDMFTQVDTSLERTVTGLGIGLTLVKSLVELHGGTVQAKSGGSGQGSEFIVRLPLLLGAASLAADEPTQRSAAATVPRRVLVVDDNRDSANSLAMLLKLTGHETHVAYDGEEAVKSAFEIRPEVVLLDIGLPKLNGYEVARKLRHEPWGKQIFLVALTGWGQDEDRVNSRDAGFDGHVVKPVELAALLEMLAGLPVAGLPAAEQEG